MLFKRLFSIELTLYIIVNVRCLQSIHDHQIRSFALGDHVVLTSESHMMISSLKEYLRDLRSVGLRSVSILFGSKIQAVTSLLFQHGMEGMRKSSHQMSTVSP